LNTFNGAVDEGLTTAEARTDEFADALAANMGSAFEDAIIAGKDFGDVMDALLDDILATIIRMSVIRPLTNAISSGLSGAFGGAFGAPAARAIGGPVKENEPYIVGEAGRELFIPESSGTIVPNNKLPTVSNASPATFGGGGDVTVNVQNNVGQADVDVSQETRPDGSQLINVILNKVAESVSSNGTVGQAMQQSFGSRHTAMAR